MFEKLPMLVQYFLKKRYEKEKKAITIRAMSADELKAPHNKICRRDYTLEFIGVERDPYTVHFRIESTDVAASGCIVVNTERSHGCVSLPIDGNDIDAIYRNACKLADPAFFEEYEVTFK